MNDQIIRAMTKDGFVKAVAVSSTGIVERARNIHHTLPTATAALGRLLSAASMIGNMQKTEDGSVTLRIKGGGPLGTLLAVSDAEGNVRGYVDNPQISLLEKYSELEALRGNISHAIHSVLGLHVKVSLVQPKTIERTTGKSKRIVDLREQG